MLLRILIAFACMLAAARESHARTGLLADGHLDTAALRDAYLQSDIPMLRGTLEGFMKSRPKKVDRSERIFTHLYLGAIYAGESSGRAMAEGHFRSLLRLDPGHDPAAMYFPPQVKAIFEAVRAEVALAAARAREVADARPVDARPADARPAPQIEASPTRSDAASARLTETDPTRSAPVPATAAMQSTPGTNAQSTPGANVQSIPNAKAQPAPTPAAVGQANRSWIWWTLGSAMAAVGAGVGVFALVEANSDPGPRRVEVDATLK